MERDNKIYEEALSLASAYNPTQVLDIIDFLEEEDEAEGEVVSIPRAPRRHFPRDQEGKEPIPDYINYFKQRRYATGLFGFNVFQKCASAIRQLAYGIAPDAFDEYLHMGESTSYLCLENFCKSVLHLYSAEYMRRSNAHDVQRLISKPEEIHGFSGMLGSLDCMHWGWKNCPVAWKGQFTRGDHGYPTIMLEAVASYDTWIWHSFFGPAGSNNDINVLNQLDLFNELLKDMSPPCNYTVNGLHFSRLSADASPSIFRLP
ncbi:uncharacterized protein [Rutidosis leptorrhynchoides]|uniref:uncharacterized protein n=1 Tax=Rutidosis leptorrhynchoides TaxID=125765 RepID=UPI003A995795